MSTTHPAPATVLAASAASCFTGTPAEFQQVTTDDDGRLVVEYRHTKLDADALGSVVSTIAGRLTAAVGRANASVDRVRVVGYSPVDPDEPALKYHIRQEWGAEAVDPNGMPPATILQKIAEHAEDFVDVEGGVA